MMLQQVLQSAVDGHHLTPARVGPMRTAVKQFSTMFGVPPEQLAPEQYHLPKEALFRFIEQHSSPDMGPSKLRNTKNNVRWLLDLAVQEGWIRPSAGGTFTWHTRFRSHEQRLYRKRTDDSQYIHGVYALLLPAAERMEGNHLQFRPYQLRQRQGLQVAPQVFLREIKAFTDWCQKAYAPDRDAKVKKRKITASDTRDNLLRIGGYAHHIAGMPLEEITLERLTDPALVQQFADWWVNERRGRVTVTIQGYLVDLHVIARHWLKQKERAEAIRVIARSLSNDQGPVWDKEQALIPLKTLEEAGLRNYPFSAERLQRGQHIRALYRYMRDPDRGTIPCEWRGYSSWSKVGTQAMMSLIIRLLVRLPMRQRCIREMRLDHNLKQLPDGNWEVHFKGIELKIASRKTSGINEYRHPVPTELNGLINEWLTFWRPFRLPEKGSDLVFMNQNGRQLNANSLNRLFIGAVYRITGIRTTIHMIRDSWASDYLDATGDVTGCADMLGDTVEMVLRHYAHVLKRRAQGRTASWLQTHLGAAD